MRLLLILASLGLTAQTVTVSLTGPATAKQGETIQITLTATPWAELSKTASHIALPFRLDQTTDGNFLLVCKPNGVDAGSDCWLASNTLPVTGGPVAQYLIKIPSDVVGRYTMRLLGLFAWGPDGVEIPVGVGPAYQILILDPSDIDGDGVVTMVDVRMLIQEMLAGVKTHDQNGDGVVDLRDIFLLLRKVAPPIVNQAAVIRSLTPSIAR